MLARDRLLDVTGVSGTESQRTPLRLGGEYVQEWELTYVRSNEW